jgi:hypothetical protein
MSNSTKSQVRRSFLNTLARAEKAFTARPGVRVTLKDRKALIVALNRRSINYAVACGLPSAFGVCYNGEPTNVTEARKVIAQIRNHVNQNVLGAWTSTDGE